MRKHLYGHNEVELIQHVLNNPPKKIWHNFLYYVLDYGNYHFTISCTDKEAKTQNSYNEALVAEFTRVNEIYRPDEFSKLICQNKQIDSISIVRTFLYFSTFETYTKSKRILNRLMQKIWTVLRGKKDPVEELISKTTGFSTEYVCHPDSEEATNANVEYSNLLDIGLLLEIEKKYLRCFLESNGFGFQIWEKKYFYEGYELKDDSETCKFIKIEKE